MTRITPFDAVKALDSAESIKAYVEDWDKQEMLLHWYEVTEVRQTFTLLRAQDEFRERVAPWQTRHNEEIKAQTLFVEIVRKGPMVISSDVKVTVK
jgi:hypothetical protein